jgi:tetratricopeptide (TPR) repeat protein
MRARIAAAPKVSPAAEPAVTIPASVPVTWLIIIFALWLASTMRDGVSKIVPKYLLPVLTAWMLVGALTVKTTLPLWHSDTSFWRWYALVAPEARLAYANYSMALQQSDQFALSIEYGAASIAQYPELGPTAYLASGISLIRSGQATTGIALLEQAGRFALSAQLQARVQGHIGEAYIDLENYVAAAAVLEAALELDPRGLVAHLQLARLYSKTGNAAGVHKHFAAVTAITDGNADIARALFEEAGISL